MIKNILNHLINEIIKRLSSKKGLFLFAKERAKFEGWLKIEICDILISNNLKSIPERNYIDIVIDDNIAIELKTINTNYKCKSVKNKHKPITENIKSILLDIEKLSKTQYKYKLIIFVVFPLPEKSLDSWNNHIKQIEKKLFLLKKESFKFTLNNENIPGIIYSGIVKDNCEFCNKNKLDLITDDNVKFCNFCASKIVKKCDNCKKLISSVFKIEQNYYCKNCIKKIENSSEIVKFFNAINQYILNFNSNSLNFCKN